MILVSEFDAHGLDQPKRGMFSPDGGILRRDELDSAPVSMPFSYEKTTD
jgi:hypothetical protein